MHNRMSWMTTKYIRCASKNSNVMSTRVAVTSTASLNSNPSGI